MKERDRYRKAIETQICPECGKGPYKSLPMHMYRAHDIDRFEFRNRAEVSQNTSITSPELSAQARERAIKRDAGKHVLKYSKSIKGKTGIKRDIPEHSLKRVTQNIKEYRESMSDDEYREHAIRASRSRTEEHYRKHSEAMKEWHKNNPMSDEHKAKLRAAAHSPATKAKRDDANRRRRQPCGTVAAYKRGCRCEPCRSAKKEYRKKLEGKNQ